MSTLRLEDILADAEEDDDELIKEIIAKSPKGIRKPPPQDVVSGILKDLEDPVESTMDLSLSQVLGKKGESQTESKHSSVLSRTISEDDAVDGVLDSSEAPVLEEKSVGIKTIPEKLETETNFDEKDMLDTILLDTNLHSPAASKKGVKVRQTPQAQPKQLVKGIKKAPKSLEEQEAEQISSILQETMKSPDPSKNRKKKKEKPSPVKSTAVIPSSESLPSRALDLERVLFDILGSDQKDDLFTDDFTIPVMSKETANMRLFSLDIKSWLGSLSDIPALDQAVDDAQEEKLSSLEKFERKEIIKIVKPKPVLTPLRDHRKATMPGSTAKNVMELIPLASISSFVNLAAESGAGKPTCVLLHQKIIVVGMSSGCSFIFDLFENHAGSVPHLFDLAHDIPITALDISPKGEILCVGDEHGNIGFWDIGGHKEIKLIRGCFSSPVTVISALPSTEKPRFACSDADGHFYFLSLNKFLFTYREEKTIISDGRLGFITCFSMVQPAEDFPHPTDSLNMFAFATYDIVTISGVVSAVPTEIASLARPEDISELCLASLTWRKLRSTDIASGAFDDGSEKQQTFLSNPVLAIGWGPYIFVKAIPLKREPAKSTLSSEASVFNPNIVAIADFSLPHSVVSLQWLGGKALLAVIEGGTIVALDPLQEAVLETVSLEPSSLLYHQFFHIPIDSPQGTEITEGQPSQCYENSLSARQDSMICLCINDQKQADFRILHLRSWTERLESLISAKQWLDALNLAIAFYDGTAKVATDLPTPAVLSDRIVLILLRYVDTLLNADQSGQIDLRILKHIAGVAIDFCIKVDRSDFLFSEVFDRFQSLGVDHVFLDCLEGFILNDDLKQLPAEALGAFVTYNCKLGRFKEAENCIYHLDLSIGDSKYLAELCAASDLESAWFFVQSEGVQDFITPVFSVALKLSEKTESNLTTSALRAYLFMKLCFMGKVYPTALPRDPSIVAHSQAQLLSGLFPIDKTAPLPVSSKVTNAIAAKRIDPLTVLLEYDPDSFFEALMEALKNLKWLGLLASDPASKAKAATASDSPKHASSITSSGTTESSGALGGIMSSIRKLSTRPASISTKPNVSIPVPPPRPIGVRAPKIPVRQNIPIVQNIVDTLIEMIDQNEKADPRVLSSFLSFMARSLADGLAFAPSAFIRRLFDFLFSGVIRSDEGHHSSLDLLSADEREKILTSLLSRVPLTTEDERKNLLVKAKRAGFLSTCELLHKLEGDYASVFQVMISNPSRRPCLFPFIEEIFSSTGIPESRMVRLKGEVVKNIETLLALNPEAASRVIMQHLSTELVVLLDSLNHNPEIQFNFLHSIVNGKALVLKAQQSSEGTDIYSLVNQPQIQEQYISLMCQFRPAEVYNYLISHQNYSIEKIMVLCKKFKIYDAAAYLLERTGDVKGSLKLILKTFNSAIEKLSDSLKRDPLNVQEIDVTTVQIHIRERPESLFLFKTLDVATHLCDRCSKRKDPDSNDLWFTLLDFLLAVQNRYPFPILPKTVSSIDMVTVGKIAVHNTAIDCLRMFLEKMKDFVPIDNILSRLSQASTQVRFDEIRETFTKMMESYSAEVTVLKGAVKVLEDDIFSSSVNLIRHHARAISPIADSCPVCMRTVNFLQAGNSILVFDCGHVYHNSCLKEDLLYCLTCKNTHHLDKRSITRPSSLNSRVSSMNPAAGHGFEFSEKDEEESEETQIRFPESKSMYLLMEQLYT